MNAWLLLAPTAFVLFVYVVTLALCKSASRGDRIADQALHRDDRVPPWKGGHRI